MKDKVKNFLNNEEEKMLWEELFNAFQEGGEEKIKNVINEKIESIKKEFDEYKKKISEKLGGGV
ncbi:MAG: hypothetical protein ABIM98_09110 [candidate division WOR-3 bacterium]